MTKDHQVTIILYAAAIVAIVLQFVPAMSLQIFSLLLLAGLMFGLPVIRKRANDASLLRNHSIYLYRTLWLWSALLAAGLVIAGYVASTQYSFQTILDITSRLAQKDIDDPDMRRFLLIAGLATAPSMVYAVWRLARGTGYAIKGLAFANPKTLF